MDQTTFCICEPEGPGSRKEQEEILCMNATAGTASALLSDNMKCKTQNMFCLYIFLWSQ